MQASALARFPHARFGAIALRASEVEPCDFAADAEAIPRFRKSMCDLLGLPPFERSYRFMSAYLTQRLLFSAVWSFPSPGDEINEEQLLWVMKSPPSELADNLDKLSPIWKWVSDLFNLTERRETAIQVIGLRVVSKMIEKARSRAFGNDVLAAPHANPTKLAMYYALPLVRIGNRYFIDADFAGTPDMIASGAGDLMSDLNISTIDLMADCIALATLAPLVDRQMRCGLIDAVTRARNCLYVSAGAGCPQTGLSPSEEQRRVQEEVFDWCHWNSCRSPNGRRLT